MWYTLYDNPIEWTLSISIPSDTERVYRISQDVHQFSPTKPHLIHSRVSLYTKERIKYHSPIEKNHPIHFILFLPIASLFPIQISLLRWNNTKLPSLIISSSNLCRGLLRYVARKNRVYHEICFEVVKEWPWKRDSFCLRLSHLENPERKDHPQMCRKR